MSCFWENTHGDEDSAMDMYVLQWMKILQWRWRVFIVGISHLVTYNNKIFYSIIIFYIVFEVFKISIFILFFFFNHNLKFLCAFILYISCLFQLKKNKMIDIDFYALSKFCSISHSCVTS